MREKSEVGGRKSESLDSDPLLGCGDAHAFESVMVYFVGDCQHDEFRPAVAALGKECRLTFAADAQAAAASIQNADQAPALVVLAQARPGQFTEEEIDRLRVAAPLARFVALLGSWCEGELRSGKAWPCVIRVYWHQWMRLLPEIAALQAGRASTWSLPATASEEERLLWTASQDRPRERGLALVVSDDVAAAQWLIDACRSLGLATVWNSRSHAGDVQGADFVICDVASDARDQLPLEIARLAAASPESRILVLANFPRWEDERRWLAAGAAAVLAKPLLLGDLYWQLTGAADAQPAVRST